MSATENQFAHIERVPLFDKTGLESVLKRSRCLEFQGLVGSDFIVKPNLQITKADFPQTICLSATFSVYGFARSSSTSAGVNFFLILIGTSVMALLLYHTWGPMGQFRVHSLGYSLISRKYRAGLLGTSSFLFWIFYTAWAMKLPILWAASFCISPVTWV